jgi:predicted ATPase/DNA-binding SARP family transcriptional activator
MNAVSAAGIATRAVTPAVRVEMLGPLRLIVGDEVVDVPGPKRRAVLALLAAAEGRAVATADVLDALWPGGVPDSARATLQSHVSRLRGHLGPAAVLLEGSSGAYRLRLDAAGSGTDVARARSLLATAAAADPADAYRLLGEARLLWRGVALAEFNDVGPLAALAVTLHALRDSVERAYATAAIDAGAADEAVEVASTLVAADPLSEASVLILMRALDAAGRAVDALRAGHDHRHRLLTETGLEPSAALNELERTIAGRTRMRPTSLPRAASGLRGRDAELAAVQRLLTHQRLVTVLGAGGVGKSALAAEIAARADHVTVLPLAPITDPAAIPQTLAAALDLHVVHGDVLSACAALLGAGPQLLVIDNCEHLLPGVRDLVATLHDGCSQLTMMATSREPLRHPAEQQVRLAPLAVTSPVDRDSIARSPAVAVFVDRARRVRPDFSPDPHDLGLVGDIVRRLDGMPLAIELAAGRLSTLDLADLHARLDHRSLDLLGDGRTVTLRRTIEWSYDLLPDHEQRLFRHLGVFPDGFDLATAESVASDLGVPADAAGALAHLVDASMIDATLGDVARYRMLDTIRSFAHDRLTAADEDNAATERFLRWAVDLATWFEQTIDTDDEPLADRVLRGEIVNLRSAWRLVRSHQRLDDAVRMAVAFGDASTWRDLTELWDWAQELADDDETDAHPEGASVLGVAAASAWSRGDLATAERLARRGLERRRHGAWRCHAALALVALSHADLQAAAAHATRAAHSADRPDQSLGIAALAHAYNGNLRAATSLNDRFAAIAISPTLKGFHFYVAGEIDALAGRTDRAEHQYQRATTLSRHSGATFLEAIASVGHVTALAIADRLAEALDGYQALIDYWARTGGWIQQWTTLRNLARLLRTVGDQETAVFLDAAANSAPDAPPITEHPDEPDTTNLPPDQIATIIATAATASRADVIAVAHRALNHHRRRQPPGSPL